MNGFDNWTTNNHERIYLPHPQTTHAGITVILRVRNESLILRDTLRHISTFADHIVAYDDASTDNTFEILHEHPKVTGIVRNFTWLPNIDDRLLSETRHRGILLELAKKLTMPQWIGCIDADERIIGDVRMSIATHSKSGTNGIRVQLFDAYLTEADQEPYHNDMPLIGLRKLFGPEKREILMFWRNIPEATYQGLDAREPHVLGPHAVDLYCQHYGKSLSIEHWEETCEYYTKHFPWDPYGKKWNARKGKAIHSISDFGRPLQSWGGDLFSSAVTI